MPYNTWYPKVKIERPYLLHYRWAKDRVRNTEKNNRSHKGLAFLLTKQQIKLLWLRDKAYNLIKPSLDRINSNLGYEYFNLRFIENIENSRKGNR